MNTKTLVSLALLVGLGAVLHAVIPGIIFGMKPDIALAMMFLGILLFPERKNVLLLGIVTGVITGLTTSFPGGQLPNMIEKPITAFLFFFMLIVMKKVNLPLIKAAVLTGIGTLLSGAIFLYAALFFVGLPSGLTLSFLMLTIVLPTVALNVFFMIILYPIVISIAKRSNLILETK
ncbi:tryptophan transporter [Sutcliffiella rhizosphaerae]|uniref:Tryptophan transport protein n=1 Tax=Sutcliffiella rhizosphaerae TaxID=2880967 RepID=A0ABN8ABF5_9BACI|nr:tryptophan transporter [Sutcliffiella rhizosphaerae]CAG9622535.1 putative tryptophan transport protein [Sutcliffiella rhizosphaerae]